MQEQIHLEHHPLSLTADLGATKPALPAGGVALAVALAAGGGGPVGVGFAAGGGPVGLGYTEANKISWCKIHINKQNKPN